MDWPALLERLLTDIRMRTAGRTAGADPEAWVELYRLLRLFGLTVIRRKYPGLTTGDLEDLVQELVLKLHDERRLMKLQTKAYPDRYIMTSFRNAAIDLMRKAKRDQKQRDEMADISPTHDDPRERYARAAIIGRLREEMEHLSKEEKKLLYMVFWRKWSFKRIAKELRVNYSTVATRLFRLLRKLKDRL